MGQGEGLEPGAGRTSKTTARPQTPDLKSRCERAVPTPLGAQDRMGIGS